MTNDNYINRNLTPTFTKGDRVVMHTCHESTLDKYKDVVWECQTDSFTAKSGDDVVFLIGFSGYFECEFLKHFTTEMLIEQGVVKLKTL